MAYKTLIEVYPSGAAKAVIENNEIVAGESGMGTVGAAEEFIKGFWLLGNVGGGVSAGQKLGAQKFLDINA